MTHSVPTPHVPAHERGEDDGRSIEDIITDITRIRLPGGGQTPMGVGYAQ